MRRYRLAKKARPKTDRACLSSRFGSGDGKASVQRSAYLTWPAFAGLTVTHSWGLAPRSAAGSSPAAPPDSFRIITPRTADCKRFRHRQKKFSKNWNIFSISAYNILLSQESSRNSGNSEISFWEHCKDAHFQDSTLLTYFRFDFSRLYDDLQAGNGQPIFSGCPLFIGRIGIFFPVVHRIESHSGAFFHAHKIRKPQCQENGIAVIWMVRG